MANKARRKRIGKRIPAKARQRYRVEKDGSLIPGIVRKNDAKNLKSFQLGCLPGQQAERIKWFDDNGVRGVKFHPETAEAIWPDRQTQIKAAKLSGYEVD